MITGGHRWKFNDDVINEQSLMSLKWDSLSLSINSKLENKNYSKKEKKEKLNNQQTRINFLNKNIFLRRGKQENNKNVMNEI